MSMLKADLVKIISEKMGSATKESTEMVEQVFEVIKETLESGEKVKISGFGNFNVRAKRPRKGHNIKTGQEILISGRRVVTFKPGNVLRKALNKIERSEIQPAIPEG